MTVLAVLAAAWLVFGVWLTLDGLDDILRGLSDRGNGDVRFYLGVGFGVAISPIILPAMWLMDKLDHG